MYAGYSAWTLSILLVVWPAFGHWMRGDCATQQTLPAHIALYVSGKTCHKDKGAFGKLLCPKFHIVPGLGDHMCIVNKTEAFSICAKLDGCEYVATSTLNDFDKLCPHCAVLGKGPLQSQKGATTCELPKSDAGDDSSDGGKTKSDDSNDTSDGSGGSSDGGKTKSDDSNDSSDGSGGSSDGNKTKSDDGSDSSDDSDDRSDGDGSKGGGDDTKRDGDENTVKTVTVSFEGDYAKVVGANKKKFLEQCSAFMSKFSAKLTCTDVRSGSILVDLQGSQADLRSAVSGVATKGLQLEGFPPLEVKGLLDL